FSDEYDLVNSFVIGDRLSDVELAKNLGSKALYINNPTSDFVNVNQEPLQDIIALETKSWEDIYLFLKTENRTAQLERNTNETQIAMQLNLDGTGQSHIETGIPFFDHMLDQLARHG